MREEPPIVLRTATGGPIEQSSSPPQGEGKEEPSKERGRTLVRTPTCSLKNNDTPKNKDIQGITIPGILQQGLGIEVVLLDVLEIVEGAYLEFLASRLIADDDTMLVHL